MEKLVFNLHMEEVINSPLIKFKKLPPTSNVGTRLNEKKKLLKQYLRDISDENPDSDVQEINEREFTSLIGPIIKKKNGGLWEVDPGLSF
jgi:hypothetical protein